ncbi:MAG: type II secretion system protein N [Woeseiaceae bacterium]
MIKTNRGLLLVAGVTLSVALVAMFPARVAYRWIAPEGISASGIQGTAWRGSAEAVSAQDVFISDVSWKIKPLHLLIGQAKYHVKGSPVSGFVEADVGVGIGGTLAVSDLTASLPLNPFAKAFNVRGLQGDASLQFERIELQEGLPVTADGTVRVSKLVTPRLSRDTIGGYEAEFFSRDDGIAATIEDTDGVLDLAGSLEVKEDGSYQFLGKVVAKPQAPAGLKRQIENLGSADERGQREIRVEGVL